MGHDRYLKAGQPTFNAQAGCHFITDELTLLYGVGLIYSTNSHLYAFRVFDQTITVTLFLRAKRSSF